MSDHAAAAGDPTVAPPSPSEAPEPPPPSIGELKGLLGAAVSIADDHRFRRRLSGTRTIRKPSKRTRALHDIAQQIDEARRAQARRLERLPTPRRPDDLPITARADEVVQAIRDSQVVVVAGETGSGKSTQLPKLCLEAGLGVRGLIGHTQPRRIAARAVAERVAEELDSRVGEAVGYTVRFTDQVGPKTLIKVMTDGILLNELQRDRDLRAYEVLIIDEAHERGLNIDFILGYLKQLLPRRPDLKVIITSATIDTERFAGHFTDADGRPAPIIEVSGRTYPVDLRYRPLDEGWPTDEDDDDDRGVSTDVERELVEGIGDAVEELISEGPGDILVFASGERDIREAAEALRKRKLKGTEILPLYARLSADEQHRVFAPHRGRRIVIATNIAETSLTVPGIRYVIDPGLARISRYSRRTKVQRLPIEKVSQASANQRSGRCGRIGPGIAIRLYAEDDFATRSEFTEPEILRTNLASVILQMTALGLGDVGRFPFVDPPEQRQISDGVALLEELGAITPDASEPGGRALTDIGRKLARLPADPRLARMIVAAADEGCVEEVIVIAAALSIQDPREHPREARAQAEAAHDVHVEPGSDYLTLLNIWEHVQKLRSDLGSSAFRRQVKREFLHHLRIREWMDVVRQLRRVARDLGLPMSREPQDPMAIHRAMLAGLLSNVGLREGNSREYLGTRGTKFVLGRRSALADDPPGWIVAAELVETARTFAGMAGSIRPQWVEALAGELVTRTHAEAFWDDDRAQAVTLEKVSFRGIPLAEGRRVPLSPHDPAQARQLFIEHALIAGEWSGSQRFQADNAARVREVHKLEARLRRPGLMAPEDVVADHYQLMVPADVVDGQSFDRWWATASRDDPHLLDVSVEQLLESGQDQLSALADFPDTWTSSSADDTDGSDLQLNYRYDPDDPEADGVTIDIPLTTLPRVHPGDFDWQVPGLREELVVALIRALPKPLRRALVPAPDTARQVLSRVGPDDGPLLPVLARELTRIGGVDVTVDSWAGVSIPDHLRMRYRVIGDDGALASGRDLGALKKGVEAHLRKAVRDATPVPHHTGLTGFSIAPLPQEVRGGGAGVQVVAYPALVDEGQTVGVRAFSTRHEQARAMRQGTRRLLRLNIPSPVRAASEGLDKPQKLALTFAPHADVSAVIEDCTACVIDAIVDDAGGPAWNAEDFEQLRVQVRDRAPRLVVVTARATAGIVQTAQAVRERLRAPLPSAADEAKRDVAQQLGRLVYPGFVAAAGGARLSHLPRYLQGMLVRLDAVGRNTSRDSDQMALVRDLEEELRQLRRLRGESLDADAADAVRWQLEELRIQAFAQQLGTAQKVSEARVREALERLRRA